MTCNLSLIGHLSVESASGCMEITIFFEYCEPIRWKIGDTREVAISIV